MKKYLIFGLMMMFAFVLAACQTTTTTTAAGTTTTTTTQTTTTTTTALNTAYVDAIYDLLGEEADVPEGFAEALVSNGMTPTQFALIKTAMETFVEEVEASEGDPILVNEALTDMLATEMNLRALLSGAILFIPVQIADDIQYMEEDIVYYQGQIALYGDESGWYAEQIVSNQDEIARMEDMLIVVEENLDELVDAALITLEYLIEIQGLMDSDWITAIKDFTDPESPTYMSITEIVLVKDEISQMFLDNLPTQTDVETLLTILWSMAEAMTGTPMSDVAETMIPEYAETALLEIEVFLTFLTYIDEPFLTDVFDMMGSDVTEAVKSSETVIMVLHLVDTFLTDEAALITELESVFSLAQQTALFDDFIGSIDDLMIASGAPEEEVAVITEIISGLTFTLVNGAMTTLDEIVTELFDYLVATDGELIRQIVISNGFESGYYDEMSYEWVDSYFNNVLNYGYANYTEFANAKDANNRLIVAELLGLFDVVFTNMSAADLNSITGLVIAVLPVDQIVIQSGMTALQIEGIITQVQLVLGTSSDDLLALINSLIDYAVTNEVIAEIDAMEIILNDYYVTNFGADYRSDYMVDLGHKNLTELLYAVKQIDTYYDGANITRIQTLIDDVFAALNNPVILELMDITALELADQKTMIEDMIDEVTAQIAIVATYYGLNVETLTEAQRTEIDTLMSYLNGPQPVVE